MSLYKSLKFLYLVNLILAIITLVAMIPISQVKGS